MVMIGDLTSKLSQEWEKTDKRMCKNNKKDKD